ncbi:DNA polymerase III subunit delta [Sphingomonas sp. HDW15A]|uniref:DNA polymerase III subunit delta n=1 Tax=Sphingomonas sp. HDW15A TaxID=2714942 RepID=UPI00140AC8EE|nr:DNA polymerase III subunit delta [Sphingomonas sp. HDW15A]QIK96957.1 DNA polymerase III subunit delta [Sphingomonas sp. HDW15A]
MIVKGAAIGPALDKPEPGRRFYLFHGQDEAGSRALGERLLAALGAEKFAVSAASIREDPASLSDEAAAMALFGGPRAIWIEPCGDEIADGVSALLEASCVESPVIAVAGALRKTSSLLKLAEGHAAAVAIVSYVPEGGTATRMVMTLASAEGLHIDKNVAERIADEAGGNQAVVASELAKYALFLGATRDTPKLLTHDTVDLLGCGGGDGDLQRLGDLALGGAMSELLEEIDASGLAAKDSVTVLRALQRRLLMIAPLRARVADGESAHGVMASAGRAIFWKDKDFVEQLLRTWPPEQIAALVERTAKVERELMGTDAPEVAAIGEHLLAVARSAQRRR